MKDRNVRVVRVGSRRFVTLLWLLAVVVVLAGLLASYHLGQVRAGMVLDERSELRAQIAALEAQAQATNSQLVDAQVAAEVDQSTVDVLREELAQMHEEQALLREEVTFYRSLMAPSDLERGLQIAEFGLTRRQRPRRFRYELLLTQVEARRAVVQGRVTIDVVGTRNNEQVVLPLTDFLSVGDYPLKYRFRYFQDFGGTLELPEGFEPARVVVTVTRQGSRQSNLQRTFEWIVEAS